MKKIILSTLLLAASGHAKALEFEGNEQFNQLQNNSVDFVISTCLSFGEFQDDDTALEQDFTTVCGSMANSLFDPDGDGSRQLDTDTLAGAFQNIVPEETLAPVSIAANTSSLNLSTINSRLAKIRFGGGAGDDLFSSTRLGFFINGIGGFGETDQTSRQDASDFESKGVISGFDFKLTDNFIVGLAGSYSFFELDFENNLDVAGGNVESDSYSVTAYSNYAIKDGYVEGVFSYGWSDYDIDRAIFIDSTNPSVARERRVASASPEGEQFSASLGAGYDFHKGSLSYGPYARVSYLDTEIDSYTESGAGGLNLRVGKHKADSLETVLGMQMSYALSQSWGVFVPHVRAEWHHEFKNSPRIFDVAFAVDPRSSEHIYRSRSDSPDRNFANISAGFSTTLKHGISTFFDYETILGIGDIEAHKFSAGVRVEL